MARVTKPRAFGLQQPLSKPIFTCARLNKGGRRNPVRDGTPIGRMRHVRRWTDIEDDEAGANRQTASLAAMAVLILLVVVGLELIHTLRYKATIEDCLLSGRTNCAEAVSLP